MTNQEIENRMDLAVRSERKITNEILTLIREAEKRRLYLEGGFSSTHDWLIRKYGYSQSAANRRVQASRLLGVVPGVSDKLKEGTVNLTTLTQVQSTIRREEKRLGQRISPQVKHRLVEKIEGKSFDETQRLLVELFPEAQPPRESLRACTAEDSRLTVVLDAETTAIIMRAKELLSHSHPEASWAEIIKQIGTVFLKARDPLKKKMTQGFAGTAEDQQSARTQSTASQSSRATVKNHQGAPTKKFSRHRLGAALKRAVLQRANHSCEFMNEETGRYCGSRYQVEVDHILALSLGGTDELSNLRCLCRRHNILMAERNLGRKFMEQWRLNLD